MGMIRYSLKDDPSRMASRVGIWTSLSVFARLAKHLLIGPMQVINLPLIFTMLAGYFDGASVGFIVGFLSFLISDSFLGMGLWTLVDGFIAGLIGSLMGIFRRVMNAKLKILFVSSYLFTLSYDILTSWLLYMAFGLAPLNALVIGIIGLFLPVSGGNVLAIGPITEALTAISFSLLVVELKRRKILG
ncbi:MAG: hypothetical protein RMI85_04115 [Candidatus Korarchaeum sp.]|nr:hypothetical protein [Candidatus Korarchaeum sp.]